MLDVTIYYNDGTRSMYDHVAQITHVSDNLVFDFITDFNDHIEKVIASNKIERLTVKIYGSAV